MAVVRRRFIAVVLHPIYALGSFGLLVVALALSRGLIGIIAGELFLVVWTVVCLAWWWWLLKRSGFIGRIDAPRRKLATAAAWTLLVFLVEGWLLPRYYSIDLPVMLLTVVVGADVANRRLRVQRASGFGAWWPTTSTGVWLGIVAGLYTTILIVVNLLPSLG